MEPLVSIIIPVYNAASFLPECLESVMNQSYKNIEIICVNDGSTDTSLSILKKYTHKDKRIKYYTQENKGQSAARNKGLSMCKGKYVTFVDSDDLLDPYTITIAMDIFTKQKVDVVIYNMEMFLPNGVRFECFNGPLFPISNTRTHTRANEYIVNFTNAAPAVFKKETIRHQFVENMIYEDWVFMTQYLTQSLRVFWYNEPLYKYRRNFESSTTSNISIKCLDLFKAYHLADKVIRESEMKNTYKYVNDIKILNEASGFIQANLFNAEYNSITEQYILELIKILKSFSVSYYEFLLSYICEERKNLLNLIMKDILKDDKVINCYEIYLIGKKQYTRHLKINSLQSKIRNIGSKGINKIKLPIKKGMAMMLPAYRVSLSTREKLEILMLENKNEFKEINMRINHIESMYKDIQTKKIKINGETVKK